MTAVVSAFTLNHGNRSSNPLEFFPSSFLIIQTLLNDFAR